MINKQRLIITSIFSIFLVSILLLGSTYSIFSSKHIDPNANIYQTGNLDIIYTIEDENIKFNNIIPLTEEEALEVLPIRLNIINNGTTPYKFNLILNNTTANTSNMIDNNYIMTKVGRLDTKTLENTKNNILTEGIILNAGESLNIDIRIWIADTIKNSEIGKSFYGKIQIEGYATYEEESEIDNSKLSLNYMNPLYLENTYRDKINYIAFVNYIDTTNSIISFDLSSNKSNNIVGWIIKDNDYYKLYIGSFEEIYTKDLNEYFSNMPNLQAIDFTNLNTTFTKEMINTFSNSNKIEKLNLSTFNTKNLKDASGMFKGCTKLSTTINFNNNDLKLDSIFENTSKEEGSIINVICDKENKTLIDTLTKEIGNNTNIQIITK